MLSEFRLDPYGFSVCRLCCQCKLYGHHTHNSAERWWGAPNQTHGSKHPRWTPVLLSESQDCPHPPGMLAKRHETPNRCNFQSFQAFHGSSHNPHFESSCEVILESTSSASSSDSSASVYPELLLVPCEARVNYLLQDMLSKFVFVYLDDKMKQELMQCVQCVDCKRTSSEFKV